MSEYFYNPDTGELYHYGVPGMKWGKRKAKQISSNIRSRYGRNTSTENDSKPKSVNSSKRVLSDKQKKALKVGAAVATAALATYGAYKMSNAIKEKAFKTYMDQGENYMQRKAAMIIERDGGNYKQAMRIQMEAQQVANSTLDSIKYLRKAAKHPGAYV